MVAAAMTYRGRFVKNPIPLQSVSRRSPGLVQMVVFGADTFQPFNSASRRAAVRFTNGPVGTREYGSPAELEASSGP